MRVTNDKNEEIRRRAGTETKDEQVEWKGWTWLDFVLRTNHHCHTRTAFTRVPEGKRKRVPPWETSKRTVEKELKARDVKIWTEEGASSGR